MTTVPAKLILASQSPRRTTLMTEAGYEFDVQPAAIEEKVDPTQTPTNNAMALALQKARWVASRQKRCFVIGADTLVVLDEKIIGKPTDPDDAERILTRISGRPHQVITGVAVINPESQSFTDATASTVQIKTLTREEIRAYIKTGEPMDKAGAYAIQGQGAFMVTSWSGPFDNIVGLPVDSLRTLLREAGYRHPSK
ncbi:MAG: septum formation protein Maf [Nitrospina sp.]|nr:MAG: septum formation protein Maf [Nitrospina sp.]